jgi:peptide/nickel transport system ATP-binding protein
VILNIDNLWVEGRTPDGSYRPIVKGVSVEVGRGEVVALIGESGSGKTTTALAALGYSKPGCQIVDGRVWLNKTDILSLDSEDRRHLRGREVAYVAQSAAAAFNPAININRQVTESSVIHGLMPRDQALRQAVEIYQRLDLPEPETLGDRYPHQVSGGQLQRLMAAMALSSNPDLLILDEPTTALDVTTQIEVLTAFKDIIKAQGTAAIYVTHDLAVVAQIADQIVVLFDGEVMERGTASQIISRPTHDYTRKLMEAVRPPPKTDSRYLPDLGPTQDTATAALETRALTAGYGRLHTKIVLQDVNMSVTKGQVIGVIGESGGGKSTFARVIAGLLPQQSGEVLHHGRPLPHMARQREKNDLQHIQIVFQMPDVAINPRHRVREILGRPLEFFLGMPKDMRTRRIDELLERVELPRDYASRYPGELSGGEKQRVNLARALAAEPEIILCDEVTSSLDTVVGKAIIDLLRQLQGELGVAYVFISHDLSTVASFADHIVVLYAGWVVEQGPLRSVLSPPYHPYTRLLLSSVPELRTGWLEDVITSREALAGIAQSVEIGLSGCAFFRRCPLALDGICDNKHPPQLQLTSDHEICCHREIGELSIGMLKH